jgi:hypothetical protein
VDECGAERLGNATREHGASAVGLLHDRCDQLERHRARLRELRRRREQAEQSRRRADVDELVGARFVASAEDLEEAERAALDAWVGRRQQRRDEEGRARLEQCLVVALDSARDGLAEGALQCRL